MAPHLPYTPRWSAGTPVPPRTLTGDGTPMVARTESMKANRAKLRAAEKAARKVRASMAKRRKKGNR